MKRRTLATCCATHTLHDGLSDVSYVLLPLLAQTFGLSLAQVGLIRSAHRTAMAAFQIPAVLILAGVGSAVQHPLCSAIISRAFPQDGRRAALGTYNFAGDVGKFAFGGVVSLLLVAGLSWQIPVIGFGVA